MTRASTRARLIAWLVVLLTPASPSFAANSSCASSLLEPPAVMAANTRFEAAMLASDTTEMGQLLHPDFLFITSAAEVRDRKEVLRSYGAREVRLAKFQSESINVRIFDTVAILNADVTKEGDYGAGPRKGSVFSGRYRFTRVFVCAGQGWQLVSTHESQLPE